MAQQQPAPSVGEVIDGYRFKGGDPKQESSWEQIEPLAAPEYGQGAMRLPNGAVVRYGPRGGMDTIVSAAQAAAAGAGTESAPLVGADARARFMINLGPLQAAQDNLERMDREGYNPSSFQNTGAAALEAIPFDAGWAARVAGGEDYTAYNQAAKTFEAAILPIMSGAAVTPTEAQRLIRAALPQPGDSPEVLAQKSEQRRMMINAVAQGIGQAAPYEVNQADDLRIRDLLPDETPETLTARGMTRGADGVWRFPRDAEGNPIFPDDAGGPPAGGGSNGVDGSARPGSGGEAAPSPASVIQDRRADEGIGRRADTFVRGIADAATFGLSDEITAGLNTVLPLDRGTQGGWSGDWGGAYRQNLDLMRGIDEADAEQMPLTRGAGQLVGAVGSGVGAARLAPQALRQVPRVGQVPRVAGPALNADRMRRGANAVRAGIGGAAAGGAYGFGAAEGDVTERGGNALEGAAIGGVLGPVVEPLARPVIGAVRGVGDAGRRLFRPNALEDAAGTYASRFRPDTNALAARADELEALGIEPRFINLVSDARHGTFRALNTRGTDDLGTARDVASRLPETMRRNLPSRVRRIAEEEISTESRPALEMMEELSAARRANAQSGSQDFNSETVRLDDNIASALRSPVARSSLTQAAAVMEGSLDPAERQAAEYIRRLATDDAGRGAMMTVREVQDVTQALNTAARSAFNSENPTAGPTLSALARSIRDQGRQQSEGYRQWLTQYADDSQLLEAVTTGRNFVTADPNPINARSTDAFVRQAEQATPPELMMQRAAARGAMEAQGSGPSGARVVLENLTSNLDQQRRASALGLDAPRLAARSEAELRVLQDAQRVSPRSGSETGTNVADQAAEVAGVAGDVMAGRPISAVTRMGRRLMSLGFSDQQAEAIGLAALDPTRTREIIDLLATRMNRQDARSTLRSIRFSAAQQSGQYAGDDE
jgi:hypothetical protein